MNTTSKVATVLAVAAAVIAPATTVHAGAPLRATYVEVNAAYTQCDLALGSATVQRGGWLAQPYLNGGHFYWSAMELPGTTGVVTSVRLVLVDCANAADEGLAVQINTRNGLVRVGDGWSFDGTSRGLDPDQVGSPSGDPAVQDLYFKVTH